MMRPVYFLADPCAPHERVHIGAMVRDDAGVRFEAAAGWDPRTEPGIGTLRWEQLAAVRLAIHELSDWHRMDALPMSVGPQVCLGEPTHPERTRP